MTVVTRFAPSPTGFLHIGSARTALFNWLFARHHGGKYLLRIEDTDLTRSTTEAIDAIFDSLNWLELDHDGKVVFQSHNQERHRQVALELLAKGKAYKCYCSPEELEQMREDARKNNLPPRYNGLWRDRDPSEAPKGVDPVIRFKAPQHGASTIHDLVQGSVTINHDQLDDMVLLRADGTPTYMLSVVVDDKDMGITHIIRGDDHLTNAFRQLQLYLAMDWTPPLFAHIPLIHGHDGAKLSKRHGALGAEAYRDMGFLPEAMRNYLLRLGWSHGDDEIISTNQAVEWFNLESIGRSPARFDMLKLANLNGHYIRGADNQRLLYLIVPLMEKIFDAPLSIVGQERILKGMDGLKDRAKTLVELAESALFYEEMQPYTDKAMAFTTPENSVLMDAVKKRLEMLTDFTHDAIEQEIRATAEDLGVKLGALAQPLRVAITGSTVSPSMFEVIEVFGREETLRRLNKFIGEHS